MCPKYTKNILLEPGLEPDPLSSTALFPSASNQVVHVTNILGDVLHELGTMGLFASPNFFNIYFIVYVYLHICISDEGGKAVSQKNKSYQPVDICPKSHKKPII